MIKFEIDGQAVEAQPGSMIIQAADEVGIYIPRFCYHKKLSVAANCRMCLIQIGEGKKPAPACATPVGEGMKVFTKSEVAINAQKAVMEFLLINHPLDCPICDQGGQCELQDLALGFGKDKSRYTEPKRVVSDQNIGPLVETDMTRCIQCTRCVRFGREVAGLQELGVLGRGEHEEIGTFVAGAMKSELSGNVIEVCPVGALTAKPSRYKARAWELKQKASLSPHDGIGSHLYVHTRRNEVMRVVPRENESINEVWLSDRDRFSYEGLYAADRITQPLIKREGQWETVDWLTALEYAAQKLQTVLNTDGASQLAGLISANSTLEEHYLFQKLLRAVGCDNIDYRLQQLDPQAKISMPHCSLPLSEIENCNAIFLIGANIQKDQPILSVRIRKAVKKGGSLMSLQTATWQQTLPFTESILSSDKVAVLAAILKAAGSTHASVQNAQPGVAEQAIAKNLLISEKAVIFVGADALNDLKSSEIIFLSHLLAEQTGKTLAYLPAGSNTSGAYLTGCLPKTKIGMDWQAAFTKGLAGYLLMGVEPEFDCARPGLSLQALKQAKSVIVMNTFTTPSMLEYADVILPIAPFAENAGTLINVEGHWQSFVAATLPVEETRPGWKVLRVLSHFLKVENMEYANLSEVTAEVKQTCASSILAEAHRFEGAITLDKVKVDLRYVFSLSSNRVDPLVRRAASLQARPENRLVMALNSKTAEAFQCRKGSVVQFKQGNIIFNLPVEVDEAVADQIVIVMLGFEELIAFDPALPFEVQHVG
jgi:NADH-quinone oxidoreductase subunit G